MPGQRDDQKYQQTRNRMPAFQVSKVSVEQQEGEDNAQGKDNSDESLGEHAECTGHSKAPCCRGRRLWLLERDPEKQHGERELEADDHVRDEDAGVDEDAEGSEQDQGGIEAVCFGGE